MDTILFILDVMVDIREHYVTELPQLLEPSAKYFVLDDSTGTFSIYIGSITGEAKPAGYATISQLNISITNNGLVGSIDGINQIFETQGQGQFKDQSTRLYINGVRQYLIDDYDEIDDHTIQIIIPPVATDKIIMDYTKK